MTVVRGDAARALMARTRPDRRQQMHSYAASSWSQRMTIDGPDLLQAGVGWAERLLRQRLIGTSLAQRHDDVVVVMTELLHRAFATSQQATLNLSCAPADHVLLEVTAGTLATNPAAHEAAGHRDVPQMRPLTATAVMNQRTDAWGVRAQPAGTCTWARFGRRPSC